MIKKSLFKNYRTNDLKQTLKHVDYIILAPCKLYKTNY